MSDWITWATRRPGPSQKVYGDTNMRAGLVLHSVEGWLNGAFGELDSPERQASWHFTNALDGTLYQHYPLTASCWASGNFEANTRFVAMESEGHSNTGWDGAGPLNAAQVATALRLVTELGFTNRGVNLFEHNEVATRWSPNAGPTACPSGRYAPLYAALEGDDEMDRLQKLEAGLARAERLLGGNAVNIECYPGWEDLVGVEGGFPVGTVPCQLQDDGWKAAPGSPTYTLTGEPALEACDRRGFSFPLGLRSTQIAQNKHQSDGHGG